jgi:hypothetical protein
MWSYVMWVVEELRRNTWACISRPLDEGEAQQAVRRLRAERPWRAYRLSRV